LTPDDLRSNNNESIISACENGHLEIVKYLVSIGITLDDIRSNDSEAINIACANGHVEIVKYLVSLGLTLEDIRSNDSEAVKLACERGRINIIKYFISIGLTLEDMRSNDNKAVGYQFNVLTYLILLGVKHYPDIEVGIREKISVYDDWRFASHVPHILQELLAKNIVGVC
jgi:hypothetical protein